MMDKKKDGHGSRREQEPGRESQRPGRSSPGDAGLDVEESLKQQPDWVQAEIRAIRKHEATVLRALAEEDNRKLFMVDPARFLRKLDIPISGALAQRLRADRSVERLEQGLCFGLPQGQRIKPRVRIHFTK